MKKAKDSASKSFFVNFRRHWQLYLMVVPAVIHLILFPYRSIYGVQIAFKDFQFKDGIIGSPWVGFDHFVRMFKSYWYPIILKNTLLISFLEIVVSMPFTIAFAMCVNEIKSMKVKKVFQTVVNAPHFISAVVMAGMLSLFLSPTNGIINKFIEMLGGEAIAFLQYPEAYKWIHVISGMWQGTGWGAILYLAALASVDPNCLEAAEIDGASRLQRIWYINIPTIIPTICMKLILAIGSIMTVNASKILLLQNKTNLLGSEVIGTYVYKVGIQQYDYSFASAVGLFNSLVNTVLILSANWFSKKVAKSGLW